jgi:hypothetical protein
MNNDDIIAGLCLYGFISREAPAEQKRCLREIERQYGSGIADVVKNYLKREKR